jgi:hypothetical protein
MLVKALRNLENLEDVVIRSFNSGRRSRDGPVARWRSYGATTAEREIGRPMRMDYCRPGDSRAIHFPHLLFNSLLDALGAAGSRPTGIEIMGRGVPPLRDSAFALNPSIRPSVASMIHGLEKLHLHVEISTSDSRISGTVVDKARQSSILPWFLTQAPNLKNLRINGNRFWSCGLETFLMWLGQPVSYADSGPAPEPGPDEHGWPPPVALPKLEELSLGHMATGYTTALGVIRKFAPTLKRLELWNVTLASAVDDPLRGPTLDTPDLEVPEPVLRHFLHGLLSIPVDLRHIMMGFIIEEPRMLASGQSQSVSFGGEDPDRVAYTGSDWKPFIRELLMTLKTAEMRHSDDMSASDESINSPDVIEEDSDME